MPHSRVATVIVAATIALTAAACSSTTTTGSTTPSPSPAASTECPSSPAPPNPAGGPGRGPAAGAPAPKIVVPVDTSTSTLLKPGTAPQIQCGRTQVTTHADVAYATVPLANGSTKKLAMDIQVPQTSGTKPLVVYVPGGGFQMSDKTGNLPLRTFAAEAGYVVASIQYRVQPDGATYKDSVSDVKAAVRYLRAHAADYQINPASVGIWGDSAGGYLVAMTGVTNGDKTYDVGDNLDQSSDVQAVTVKFGAADLSQLEADYDPDTQKAMAPLLAATAKYVNGPASTASLADSPDAVARANPITYIKPTDPPFVIFHGNADMTISPSETLKLHNALRAGGVDSTRYVVDGAAHGDVAFTGNPANSLQWTTQEVASKLVDFLNQHLKR